ncbi:MAG TPA: L-threonylcarbamoyladenylate synthase [Bryobacteraceae bacterium]|nr:L-threonylcarbamoyladenylate synthase [Bryobacteraceae bacterium]
MGTEELQRAAELIRGGGLVAFPTETVYGLGANALDPVAVGRIFKAKGRPSTSPLIVHVDSVEMARELVEEWPEAAGTLAARYWPGPLTLVLPKKPIVPDVVTAGLATVGIRVPAHPAALALIRAAGVPIAAPSANRFTGLSPTTAEHVREGLAGRADFILDGGPSQVGIESTVLSLATHPPQLLRPGMVSQPEIESLIGPVVLAGRVENGAHLSPGMHPRHYSPETPLLVVKEGAPLPAGKGVILTRGPEGSVRMPKDAASYASALYDTLHRLDGEGWDWIAVEELPATPEWAAISDRLRRAAAMQPH